MYLLKICDANTHTIPFALAFRAQDLRDSCRSGCRCFDAERRLASGEISCFDGPIVDQCPDKCDVCTYCLGQVLADWCDGLPSASPTSRPTPVHSESPSGAPSAAPSSSPTTVPSVTPTSLPSSGPTPIYSVHPSSSQAPSSLPSSSPSLRPTYLPSLRPSDSFDLSDCDSYSYNW